MEKNAVEIRDVWKTYDGRNYVLRGINMEIPAKDTVLIEGRSGSGKSTLLNLISCVDTPSKGEVIIEGQKTSRMNQKELAYLRLHRIGIVFQSHNLLSDLTVFENIMLPLSIAKSKLAEVRVKELLEVFELQEIADRKPDEISGGEEQRVAIARAMANNPAILLADEPTASLDLKNSENVLETFQKVNREFETTVIISSHDPLVDSYVPKTYYMREGMLFKGKRGVCAACGEAITDSNYMVCSSCGATYHKECGYRLEYCVVCGKKRGA